jgi:hypothetical protein
LLDTTPLNLPYGLLKEAWIVRPPCQDRTYVGLLAIGRDERLLMRVQAEFREMPGLTLTISEAARLFNLEPAQCERLLRALVSGGVLATDGRVFAQAGPSC